MSKSILRSVVMATMITALVANTGERSAAAEIESAKLRFPLTKSEPQRTPTFVLDTSEIPDDAKAQKWAEEAKVLCEEWFPVLCKFLSTDEWMPPETIVLAMKKKWDAPGSTSGNTISISTPWITGHPDDFGMVIHELVHVIQHYPPSRSNPGWLVEGIADYVRYWKYEPEAPRRRVDAKASYRDGYGTAGSFLAWMSWKYDRRLVRRLDLALRKNEYKESLFKDLTGKELPELWTEFLEYERR